MRVFVFFMLMIGFSVSHAQSSSDSIYVAKNFWGYKYYQQDERVNYNTLPTIMVDNQEAYMYVSKAKTNYLISSIISGTGGFLLGLQLGVAIVGGDPNWVVAGVGGGLILVSIPIFSKSHKQSLKAIEIYNAGLMARSQRINLNFASTQNGIGFVLGF